MRSASRLRFGYAEQVAGEIEHRGAVRESAHTVVDAVPPRGRARHLRDIPLARACYGAYAQVPTRELDDNRRARAAPGSDDDVVAGHSHDGAQ
jgi:hypothetical protein